MNRKNVRQSKTVRYQGEETKIPSLSLNNETRRRVEDFPGHQSQARSIPSKNFGSPAAQGRNGREYHKNTSRQERPDNPSNPATIAENDEKIGRNKPTSSCGN